MRCLSPITIRSPDGFKHVPCGRCYSCLANRRDGWYIRLKEEFKASAQCYFLTLTYNEENVPYGEELEMHVNKRDVQLFIKRLRKVLSLEGVHLRYFIISEYGPTFYRPHYHGFLFLNNFGVNHAELLKLVWQCWFPNTRVTLTTPSDSRFMYCAKYCEKLSPVPENLTPNFTLCSKKPAIGSSYLTSKMVLWHKHNLATFYQDGNVKYVLPRYYRDKIFNKAQKALINAIAEEGYKNSKLQFYVDKYGEIEGINKYRQAMYYKAERARQKAKNKRKVIEL